MSIKNDTFNPRKVKLSSLIGNIGSVAMLDTGEMVEVDDDLHRSVKIDKTGCLTDFVKVSHDYMAQLADHKSLDVHRVNALLVSRLRYGGKVFITQAEIGELLKIEQPNVSRAMKVLQREGIVRRVKRGSWVMSHRCCFKGGQADMVIAQHQESMALEKSGLLP